MIVGRTAELAALTALLDRPEGAALVLSGEPGIGKSVLLDAFRVRAREHGRLVLGTAGVEQESGLPYAGLESILRPVLGELDQLRPPERSALCTALGLGAGERAEPMLVALSALELLSARADGVPAALVVDDLHWVAAATRAVLAFIARRIAGERIVLIAALRDGYDVEDLGGERLALRGLDREAAFALLELRDPELAPAVRDRLLSEAAGNPLALVELPTAAGETSAPVTARIERAFASRLLDMPAVTRRALLVAAADPASTLEEILAAAEADRDDLAPALAARLLRLEAGAVRFRHPLVGSAIYQSAAVDERLSAHAALASALADEDRRAFHRAAGTVRPDDAVADQVEAVAWRAHARGAILDAAVTLARAARLTADPERRAQRLLRSGELAFEAGRTDLVRDAVEEADRLELGVRDRARAGLLSERFHDGVVGDVPRVERLVADAREVAALGDPDLALELLRGAAVRCWWGALPATVRGEVLAAAESLDVAPHDPRLMAVVACVAPLERGAEITARVPDALEAAGDDPLGRWFVAMAAHAVGAHELAFAELRALAPTLREHGRFGLLTQVLSMLQWDAAMLGAWDVTQEAAEEGDRLARDTGQLVWGAGLTCGLSAAAAVRGEHEVADALARAAQETILPHGLADMHSVLLAARGIAAVSAGRHEDAFAILVRAFDPEDPAHHYREQFGALSPFAQAAAACGRDAEARAIVDRLGVGAGTAPELRRAVASASALLG
jgi:hypothetical protein